MSFPTACRGTNRSADTCANRNACLGAGPAAGSGGGALRRCPGHLLALGSSTDGGRTVMLVRGRLCWLCRSGPSPAPARPQDHQQGDGQVSPWRPWDHAVRVPAVVSASFFPRPTRRTVLTGFALGLAWGASGCAFSDPEDTPEYRAFKAYFSEQDIVTRSQVDYRRGAEFESSIDIDLTLKDDTGTDTIVDMLRGAAHKMVGRLSNQETWLLFGWTCNGASIACQDYNLYEWVDDDRTKVFRDLLEWAVELSQGSVTRVRVPDMEIAYQAQEKLPDDFVLAYPRGEDGRLRGFREWIRLPGWGVTVWGATDTDLSGFPFERTFSSVTDSASQGNGYFMKLDDQVDVPELIIDGGGESVPIGKDQGNGRDLAVRLIRAIQGAPVIEKVTIILEDPSGGHYPDPERIMMSMSDGVITGPMKDTNNYSRRIIEEALS